MKVLITSSRMPFALDEIRKFGAAGHTVYAADTRRTAPGSHSKYVTERFLTPSPRYQTAEYITALERIVETHSIDLLIPCFEEVFYIGRHLDQLSKVTEVFASPLETLAQLHSKVAFYELVRDLGIRAPRTIVAGSQPELKEATGEFSEFLARPAYSRGAVDVLTNTGPLEGSIAPEDCHPTVENPWVVQEFIHGEEVCSFSVCRQGRISGHSTYVHPLTLDHGGGIVFESIVNPETLVIAQRIVDALNFTGQVSFDFIASDEGLVAVECNPRPTSGEIVMPGQLFVDSVLDRKPSAPRIAPEGCRYHYSFAIIRDMLLHWKDIPSDLKELLSDTPDVFAQRNDILPALYLLLSYGHVAAYRVHVPPGGQRRNALVRAYLEDIAWDGDPID